MPKFSTGTSPTNSFNPVLCNGCHGVLFGSKYKCQTCPDYNLCQVCKDYGRHNKHTFNLEKV